MSEEILNGHYRIIKKISDRNPTTLFKVEDVKEKNLM
jgi:hypothetical protein